MHSSITVFSLTRAVAKTFLRSRTSVLITLRTISPPMSAESPHRRPCPPLRCRNVTRTSTRHMCSRTASGRHTHLVVQVRVAPVSCIPVRTVEWPIPRKRTVAVVIQSQRILWKLMSRTLVRKDVARVIKSLAMATASTGDSYTFRSRYRLHRRASCCRPCNPQFWWWTRALYSEPYRSVPAFWLA